MTAMAMDGATESALRTQLRDRRERLMRATDEVGEAPDLLRLLREVDQALKKVDSGVLGRCEVCSENVEDQFLLVHPTLPYCLCALSPQQQDRLQADLDLASRVQWSLLPKEDLECCGWQAHFRYEPAGGVSGDYIDVVDREGHEGGFYFLVGDVSGKGVAAAFVMAHLNALFRSLIDAGHGVNELVQRANRLLLENRIESHYATMVCGRAHADGRVQICNAGHCPPLVVGQDRVAEVEASGLPIGLFGGGSYVASELTLAPGESLVVYTDGLSEAVSSTGDEYGAARLAGVLREHGRKGVRALAAECLSDVHRHQNGAARVDDLSLLVLRRA